VSDFVRHAAALAVEVDLRSPPFGGSPAEVTGLIRSQFQKF